MKEHLYIYCTVSIEYLVRQMALRHRHGLGHSVGLALVQSLRSSHNDYGRMVFGS